MAADAQGLLEKYTDATNASVAADVQAKIYEMSQPQWGRYQATAPNAQLLGSLTPGDNANKGAFTSQCAKACVAAMNIKEEATPLQYILTVVYDLLREDTSTFGIFEQALREGCDVMKPVAGLLGMSGKDPQWAYVADKAAWLVSALVGHMPKSFSDDDVKELLRLLLSGTPCCELGVLDAVANLLKSTQHRELVWSYPGVTDLVLRSDPKTTPSPLVYKSVFAIWMVSFDSSLVENLKTNKIISKVKSILVHSRAEKVIRLCLTLLKNFLAQKATCQTIVEDIVEEGALEAVQQLEYEKWRDAELYDDIRELVQLISSEVKELSNFDRYMKELESGNLSWGFIHSSKFFGENVMKFETGEFKAVKLLAGLLSSSNATTLAVACHDIGEFVSLHPMGKKQAAKLGIKERVMLLMSWPGDEQREVRREALLCCQKIMLNKWQDVAAAEKK